MYPWKDTPYTFVLGIVAYFIFLSLDREYKVTLPHSIALGVAMGYIVVFRLNGLVPFIGCATYFLVYMLRRKKIRQFALAAVCTAVVIGLSSIVGYAFLRAESPSNGFSIQVFGSGIAAVVDNGGEMTETQYQKIQEILPVEWMQNHYTPWHNENLIWLFEENLFTDPNDAVLNNSFVVALGEHRAEVIQLYLELLPSNLKIMASDIVYNTRAFWDTRRPFENGTLFLFLIIAVAGCWQRMSLKRNWVIFIPIACNALSIIISTITNEPRYYQPTFALFVPTILYIVFVSGWEKQANSVDIMHREFV